MADKQQQIAVLEKLKKEKITAADLSIAAKKVADIAPAPGITIDTLLNFNGDCVEPAALQIITEALDYAMETAVGRLTGVGKIFKQVEMSAYGSDKIHGILPTIKAIRIALDKAPLCKPSTALENVPPLPEPEVKIPGKASPAVKKKVAAIEQATSQEKLLKSPEMLEAIRNNPELARIAEEAEAKIKAKKEVVTKKEESKKKVGEPPPYWGKAIFHGEGEEASLSGEYPNPTALAEALNLETRKPDESEGRTVPSAHSMPQLFNRAGFVVTANGKGEPQKVEADQPSKFHVRRVKATEPKWKRDPKLKPGGKKSEAKSKEYSIVPEEIIIRDAKGNAVARELMDNDPKSKTYKQVIPGSRTWLIRRYKVYFDKDKIALGTSEGPEAYYGDYVYNEFMELPAGPNPIKGQHIDNLLKMGKIAGGPAK